MSITWWILLACIIAYGTKLVGYSVPADILAAPSFRKASAAVTIGLLAALVATNAFTTGNQVRLDSRVLALVGAAIALSLRAPFIVVVIIGALAAAGGRLAGLP